MAANTSLSAVLIPWGVQRLGGTEHIGLLLSCLGAGFLIGAPVLRAVLDRAQARNLLTASLAATVAGPFLAQALGFNGVATVASLVALSAAALTLLSVPR